MYTTIRSFYTSAPSSSGSSTTTVTLNPSTSSSTTFRQSGSSASTYKSSSSTTTDAQAKNLVDKILLENDLYKVLGLNVNKFGVVIAESRGKGKGRRGGDKIGSEEIRRAYLERCRICHPDKLPAYPLATSAFQKLSFAYETLSNSSSRKLYDELRLSGIYNTPSFKGGTPGDPPTTGGEGEETLQGVLRQLWNEFLEGEFEMIRVLINSLNDGSPGLNLGEEAIDNLEAVFRRVRELVLSGQKYLRVIRFELIRLYEIQSDLRRLSYFNLPGRLRLTMKLARVTLEIPMAIDRAIKEDGESSDSESEEIEGEADDEEEEETTSTSSSEEKKKRHRRRKSKSERGLLGKRTRGLLTMACGVLESGEKLI